MIGMMEMSADLTELRDYLAKCPHGLCSPKYQQHIEGLLARCWRSLAGADQGGMKPDKLRGRTESMSWEPPLLHFEIERHGATVKGSVYAEMQPWSVNVTDGEADTHSFGRHRKVGKTRPRLDVTSEVQKVCESVVTKKSDNRLRWIGDSCVKVLVGVIIPASGLPKQTLAGRRKRLARALEQALSSNGWRKVGLHTYEKLN